MASGFESPKVKLTIGDGFDFMKKHREEFDVIITDSSDPIGNFCEFALETEKLRIIFIVRPCGFIVSRIVL